MDATETDYNRSRLFWIGVLALFTAAMCFSLRGALFETMRIDFFAADALAQSTTLLSGAVAAAFLGNALTLFLASPYLDLLGIGNVLRGAAMCFIIGIILTLGATFVENVDTLYIILWVSMFFQGIGWGAQEAAINPMTTALYPEDKTHRLNVLHAWWPAGLIVGGLVGFAAGSLNIAWEIALALALVPAVGVLILALGVRFPQTERAAAGISMKDMFLEIVRKPTFLIWFGAMFLTAASELAPGQWVDFALSEKVGMRGILLLVYVAGLMFVMRHFAGPLAHRLSNPGLLWLSSVLAAIGLFLLSRADSPVTAFVAATVWGIGVCFMWPTMMASVAERYPRGGSWFIGLIGSAGALAIYFVLPQLGRIVDAKKIALAGGEEALQSLSPEALAPITTQATSESFAVIALIPLALILLFAGIWLNDRRLAKSALAPAE